MTIQTKRSIIRPGTQLILLVDAFGTVTDPRRRRRISGSSCKHMALRLLLHLFAMLRFWVISSSCPAPRGCLASWSVLIIRFPSPTERRRPFDFKSCVEMTIEWTRRFRCCCCWVAVNCKLQTSGCCSWVMLVMMREMNVADFITSRSVKIIVPLLKFVREPKQPPPLVLCCSLNWQTETMHWQPVNLNLLNERETKWKFNATQFRETLRHPSFVHGHGLELNEGVTEI